MYTDQTPTMRSFQIANTRLQSLDCYKRIEKFFALWFITEHVWLWATVSSSFVSSSPNMSLWTFTKLRNGGEIEQRVEWLLICHGRTRRQVICGAYVSSERWKGEKIIIQLLLVIVLSFRSVVRNLKSLGRLPVYALTGPNHTKETLFPKPHVKIILTFSLLEAREAVVFQTKSKPAPFDQTRQRYAKKLG